MSGLFNRIIYSQILFWSSVAFLLWVTSSLLRFSKTRKSWSSEANWHLHSLLPSIILMDRLVNKSFLPHIQKVMGCNFFLWLVDFNPLRFCVSRSDIVMVIMIDSSKNTFVKVGFELQSLRFEKCRNGWSIMANSPNRFNNIDPRQAVSQAFGVNGDLNSTSLFLKEKASRLPLKLSTVDSR